MFRPAVAVIAFVTLSVLASAADPEEAAILKLYQTGRAEFAERKYDKAIQTLDEAARRAAALFGPGHPNTALMQYEIGEVHLAKEDYKQAEAAYLKTLTIREKALGKENVSTVNVYDRLGEVYDATGQYARAEPLLLYALEIRQKNLDPKHQLIERSYKNLGSLYTNLSQFTKAEKYCHKRLEWLEAKFGKDQPATAPALNALGRVELLAGRHKDAEVILRRGLAVVEGTPEARTAPLYVPLGNLGLVLQALGRYADAEDTFTKALASAERLRGPDSLAVAVAHHQLAELYSLIGRPTPAEQHARTALVVAERAGGRDAPEVSQALASLGAIQLDAGQYAKAEQSLSDALARTEARFGQDSPSAAHVLNRLGQAYEAMQLYDKAEAAYVRALGVREKTAGRDHSLTAQSLTNLGALYIRRGEYAKAEPLYLRAKAILETRYGGKGVQYAALLNNLYQLKLQTDGQARFDLLQTALGEYETAFGPDHPETARIRFNLGCGYFAAFKFAEAEPPLRASLSALRAALGDAHPSTITAERLLALNAYQLGRRDDTLALIDASRRHTRTYVTDILPGLSAGDQRTFLAAADAFELAQALTVGVDNRDQPAFADASATWLVNAKATLSETQAASVQAANAGDSKEARALREVRVELARSATATGAEATARRQALLGREKQLAAAVRDASGRGDRSTPWVGLDEIRRQLPEKGVYVDVARFDVARLVRKVGETPLGPPHYVAWVVPKSGPVRVTDFGPADEIDALVAAARRELNATRDAVTAKGEPAAEKAVRDRLAAVAGRVLHPLLADLGGADEWVVSPDGALWLLPWAALPLPDGTYAVESHTIRTVVSGRDLMPDRRPTVAPSAPLIVADPDYDLGGVAADREAKELLKGRAQGQPGDTRSGRRQLGLGRVNRLAGTAAEAEAVAPRLEAWLGVAPRVFTERQALKTLVQAARNPAGLVLSTHGFFRPDQEVELRDDPAAGRSAVRTKSGQAFEDPLARCGLLFAACNATDGADDGVLTGLDVVGMDLRGTRLVVLSACETGLGDVRNGEGVAGLRQAFQLAGAESVVATLWQVPDRESALLIAAFFGRLAEKLDRDRALCEAQRDALRKRRQRYGAAHPYYWAAYTFTGRAH